MPIEDNISPDPKTLTRRLWIVVSAMFAAQVIGSVFNIWYNLSHIRPLLTEDQNRRFLEGINLYNLTAYPLLIGLWIWVVFSLKRWLRTGSESSLMKARRRVINLPWWANGIAAAGWLLCIPALIFALSNSPEPLNPHVKFHLPVSIVIGALIALTHGFFAVDLLSQRLLYPFFFGDREVSATRVPGALPLGLSWRGILWAVSAGACPIGALLLLNLSPESSDRSSLAFAMAVGGMGIVFGLTSAVLLGRLVVDPVRSLQNAARKVGEGDTSVQVDIVRADEFGVLAEEFNHMVDGLREKEKIRQTLGQHVGEGIARELLEREEELGGAGRKVSVLFSDIRGYTTRCEKLHPQEAVTLLNRFHEITTSTVEEHGGLVNQIIGDGIMAIFGATGDALDFADNAIAAGRALFEGVERLNVELKDEGCDPIRIGVGINTGDVVVGTVGSPRRMTFTAIGDVVNSGARIESLTKDLDSPLLMSESTIEATIERPGGLRQLPEQPIRGKEKGLILYAFDDISWD